MPGGSVAAVSDPNDAPPPEQPPEQPPAPPASGPPPVSPPPEESPRPWMQSPPPSPPGGLVSGDPLAGAPQAFPPGYTSPPPPGAGGYASPPAAAAPGTGTFVLAGWWPRVGAAVIDGVLILVVAFVLMAPLGVGLFSSGADGGGDFLALLAGLLVAGLVIAVVALAYAPVMMGMTNGKTLGRMLTGIRVVRADGRPITIGFAALREVAVKTLLIGTVGGSLTFGLATLIDVLWPLWDDENRALHDFVVNTRTVRDP